jgi:hypothetical protein
LLAGIPAASYAPLFSSSFLTAAAELPSFRWAMRSVFARKSTEQSPSPEGGNSRNENSPACRQAVRMDPASIASHRLDNALLMTVTQLLRRGLEIHVTFMPTSSGPGSVSSIRTSATPKSVRLPDPGEFMRGDCTIGEIDTILEGENLKYPKRCGD